MKFYRLYTGDDNQSHFEKMDDHVASNLFNTVHAVKGLVFRIEDRPHLFAWHPAPRRQWVITLSGSVEIGPRRRLLDDLRCRRCFSCRGCYRPGTYSQTKGLGASVRPLER